MNSNWKDEIKAFMDCQRIVTAKEVIAYGEKSLSVSQRSVSRRSVNDFLSTLVDEEEAFLVKRGIYAVFNEEDPVTIEEMAPFIHKEAAVSLDTVFIKHGGHSLRAESKDGKAVAYMIVPITNPHSPPPTGEITTQLGTIRVHSLSASLLSSTKAINDPSVERWIQHSPEGAVAIAIRQNESERSNYTLESNFDHITFPEVNPNKFLKIAEKLNISEASIEHNLDRFKPEQQNKIADLYSKKSLEIQQDSAPSKPKASAPKP